VIGLLAGILAGAASGLGIPAMSKTVFPILFQDQEAMKDVPQWLLTAVESRFGGGARGREALLVVSCAFIPLVFLARAAGTYFNAYLVNKAGFLVLEGIRLDVFAKLQALPLSFYHRYQSGNLVSRVMSDSNALRRAIVQGASDLVTQPFTLLMAFSFLVYNAIVSEGFFVVLVALFSVPLCIVPIRMAGKKLIRRSRQIQALKGELTASLTESLQSPVEVRTYNLQETRRKDFAERIARLFRATLKRVKYAQMISPSIEMVGALGFGVALYFGVKSGMSLGEFLAVGAALYVSYEPVKRIGRLSALVREGQAALERLDDILIAEDALPEPEKPERPRVMRATVEFKEAEFSYRDSPALRDLNLAVGEGEVVALVGPTGAGKSTLASLIPRLHDVTKGVVEVSGLDVRKWRKAELRHHIALVPQNPTLFAMSVAANIRVGRPDASGDEIRRAAAHAHADEFIDGLPEGYDTMVGERGSHLSGGERQRVALARAFLKDAPILILDEATSALDSDTEARIQDALAALVEGKTTFVIAHRFSTLALATRIVVIERGRLAGDGTHEELMERCENYRVLYDRHSL